MRMGFITAPFPQTHSARLPTGLRPTASTSSRCAAGRAVTGRDRRYAGVCHIDIENLPDARAKEIVDDMASRGIEIPALGYYPNPSTPPRAPAARRRPPQEGDHRSLTDGRAGGEHLHRCRPHQDPRRELGHGQKGVARHRLPHRELRSEHRAGELPDAVLRRRLARWLMIDIEQAIAEFGERTCQ